MNSRILAKVGRVATIAIGASGFVLIEAKALPFEHTPEAFISYANTLSFDGGARTYEFFNPRECGIYVEEYSCFVDFKEITPLGTRTCIKAHIYYDKGNNRLDWWSNKSGFECGGWEKVSATPETSQPTRPIPTTNTSTTSDSNLILASAGIFLAGGLLGVAFSKLLGRKKD